MKNKKRLVIYLDNGPNHSGRRRQFLKRMIAFADWSGLEIRLGYDPPYPSKDNPIERCWSSLEKKWGGTIRSSIAIILARAARMTWKGEHPEVQQLSDAGPETPTTISNKEWKSYESRLERFASLPKYDITIKPTNSGR